MRFAAETERWVVGYYAVDVYEPKHLSAKYAASKNKTEAEKSADANARKLRMALAASRLGNVASSSTSRTRHGCVRDRWAEIAATPPRLEDRPM